ncbi:hypothetical protein [Pseudooceanicola atlanticus]|uniref:hypothetical protein n=1 Tax=Pseudooceanicola atlanticus TaxID=1461694 RepID=UPI0012DFEEE3|nr:hypothetical protein [Pseudooceanicola atlanticus]
MLKCIMSDDSVEYVSSSRVIRIVESSGEKILRYAKSNGAVGTLKIKQFQMCKTGTWYE